MTIHNTVGVFREALNLSYSFLLHKLSSMLFQNLWPHTPNNRQACVLFLTWGLSKVMVLALPVRVPTFCLEIRVFKYGGASPLSPFEYHEYYFEFNSLCYCFYFSVLDLVIMASHSLKLSTGLLPSFVYSRLSKYALTVRPFRRQSS